MIMPLKDSGNNDSNKEGILEGWTKRHTQKTKF